MDTKRTLITVHNTLNLVEVQMESNLGKERLNFKGYYAVLKLAYP